MNLAGRANKDMVRHTTTQQNTRIFNGYEVQIQYSVIWDNCSAHDSEQLSRVTEFSILTEQPLQILFLAYSSFDNCI